MSRFGLTMWPAALAVGFGCMCVSASADIVTYDFNGTFTSSNDPSVPIGTDFTGSFSYDPTIPAWSVATNAEFFPTGALSVSFGGQTYAVTTGQSTNVLTHIFDSLIPLGFGHTDALDINGNGAFPGISLASFEINLAYADGTFASLQLPSALTLPPTYGARLLIENDGLTLNANVDVTPPLPSNQGTVPEPSPVPLIAGTLAILVALKARSGRKGRQVPILRRT